MKIFSYLSILFLLSFSLVSGQIQVMITGPSTVTAGETVSTTLELAGDLTPAIQFEVPLGSVVTLGTDAVAAGKTIQCADTATNRRCIIYALNANAIGTQAADIQFPPQLTLGGVILDAVNIIAVDTTPQANPLPLVYSGLNINVFSACDLNSDNFINLSDVLIVINEALGVSACGSGDINSDGACNAVDAQMLINVSLGSLSCPL